MLPVLLFLADSDSVGNVFFDAAVKHVISKEYLNLYPSAPEMAKYDMKQTNVILTIGYKF